MDKLPSSTKPIAIRYSARTYSAQQTDAGIVVKVGFKTAVCRDEWEAHLWLGNHGLRRGRIKNLLAAALRRKGHYADPTNRHLVPIRSEDRE